MGVEVKLDSHLLPDDHKVWKLFPGKGYKFYDLIAGSSLVFVDVRSLGDLKGKPSEWTDGAILNAISTDRVKRSVSKGGKQPSRLVNSQGDKANLTFLKGLLFTAKKGDLVAVPGAGYDSLVRIGKLLDEPGVLKTVDGLDDRSLQTFYGRRVKWVGEIAKRRFSKDVIAQLQSRATFFDVGRSHYEEFYNLSFDSYVYDSQFVSTFRTTKDIFTSKDNFLTSVWFELLEVLHESSVDGEKLPAKASIYDLVIDSDIDEDVRDDLSISIQSPGWFRLRALMQTPLVTSAIFLLAVAGTPFQAALASQVTATTVGHATQTCLVEVDKSVKDYLELLGKDRWESACKLASQAEKEATLKTSGKLIIRPDKRKSKP